MTTETTRTRAWWLTLPAVLSICLIVLMTGQDPASAREHDEDEDDIEFVEDHDDHDEDFDEEEWEEEEWDEHAREVEFEMMEQEMYISRLEGTRSMLELMVHVAEVCEDPSKIGVVAVMTAEEYFDEPEELAEFLEEMREQVDDEQIQRAISIKLAEAYGELDRTSDARAEIRKLILDDY